MNGLEQRMERLAENLTAKERVLLMLGKLKEDRPVDPTWLSTMPDDQVKEYGGYLGKIYGLNGKLWSHILVLYQDVEKLFLQLESVIVLMNWGLAGLQTRLFMMSHTKETVTESEYRALQAKARTDPIPVDELAEVLVDESRDRGVASVEELERLTRDKAGELAALVEYGVLVGGEEDGRVYVQAGSYYDWINEPVPMQPAWGIEYEVVADDEAEQLQKFREERLGMLEALELGPMLQTARLLGPEERLAELAEPTPADDMLEGNVKIVRAAMMDCWRRLRAVEQVVEEVQCELAGEDPLLPDLRELVDASRVKLNLCKKQERIIGPLELEEPGEEDMALVRGQMDEGEAACRR